jgi:hypothetical protein
MFFMKPPSLGWAVDSVQVHCSRETPMFAAEMERKALKGIYVRQAQGPGSKIRRQNRNASLECCPTQTADPSTSLRFGRDDTFMSITSVAPA